MGARDGARLMKRTPFKPRKLPPPRPCKTVSPEWKPRPRESAVARVDGRARMVVQVPKDEPVQHERYMAAVRRLPCDHCGIVGFSQFCHADEGKGTGIKTDCREGYPGCGPHYENGEMVNGCHHLIGTARIYPKEHRRRYEAEAGRRTRAKVRTLGLWPADLEPWPEDEEATA